jgi:hypothetical protein
MLYSTVITVCFDIQTNTQCEKYVEVLNIKRERYMKLPLRFDGLTKDRERQIEK